jgi:hypothetical protein
MKHLKTFEGFSSLNEEESKFKKFLTGHSDEESKEKAKESFLKALDDAEDSVNKNPEGYVFNRSSLEKQASENNYLGGLRIQRGGRDKSRYYVVYDKGISGFQSLASAAGGEVNVFRNKR